MGHSVNLLALIPKTIYLFLPCKLHFLDKLKQLVALQIFQSSYLSCEESLNHNTSSYYYYTQIKHISETLDILQKSQQSWWLPNLVLYQTVERVLSYRADKPGIRAHTRTHTETDVGKNNTQRPKLASGKNESRNVISALKVKNILSMGKLKQIWSLKGIASRVFLES